MPIFQSVPIMVEAVQWTGENLPEVFGLTGRIKQDLPFGDIGIFSPGKAEYRVCKKGDWVLKYEDGSVRPMAHEEFTASFSAAQKTPCAAGEPFNR